MYIGARKNILQLILLNLYTPFEPDIQTYSGIIIDIFVLNLCIYGLIAVAVITTDMRNL